MNLLDVRGCEQIWYSVLVHTLTTLLMPGTISNECSVISLLQTLTPKTAARPASSAS